MSADHGPIPRTVVSRRVTSSSDCLASLRGDTMTVPSSTLVARSRSERTLAADSPAARSVRGHVAAHRIDDPAVDRPRGGARELLVDDRLDQRRERRQPRPWQPHRPGLIDQPS
jgi:hypothetical protein